MELILVLPTFLVIITFINFFTIRNPSETAEIAESVSVLVPLRNESNNVIALVDSLKNQRLLKNVEFIFLDDNSEDLTYQFLEDAVSGLKNFHIIKGSLLPPGWIGKSWALHQSLEVARGEIIISVDADVRLKPDAISKSISLMNSTGLDFMSPYPRQLAFTVGEKLIQPLLQWSWMSTVLLRIAERTSFSSMAVANGQFFIARRSALDVAGGYESVKSAVLDDVFLARRLVASGARGVVVNGADIAECRMYASWNEIEAGYGKSLRFAFGSTLGAISVAVFLFLTGIAPLIFIMTNARIGLLAYLLIVLSRLMSAFKSKGRLSYSFLHPASSALLIYLIAYSFLMRREIQWKGRTL
ncbi:MAG: glycosyltransferase [Actinobacteria bacterium]|uniref:Unannotated protein n=1 Tax=freshwater metagenome TaxID=449393 RepID=A0A6J7CVS7_9ZZZZ|nr:glycosyltransferase [Actinomycetota bacterium]